ncbi:MAG: M16 family metallopeptidase [Vicinamibacteria bacterium]
MPVDAQRVAAPPAAVPASKTALPEIAYTRFSLPNGLRVILHEDHSTPVVAVNVWYHVGSKNESAGRTGFAHLFEHMMFQGFQGYPYAFGATMDELGASRNGSTNTDRTNYYEVVPSNFLDTALFMEAGRMGRLLETVTRERLDNQRDVVKNEKRQRVDNQPYGQAFNRIMAALYPREHPYSWPVIGSMEDLTAASLEDVSAFFRTYYAPNNASLVLAGDFDPARARALVEKHFGAITSGAAVQRPQPAQPHLDREIREDMEDSVQLPRLYLAWHSTPMFSKSEAAADMLAIILGGGKSSRLYKALQFDRQIVQDAFAGNPASELAGLFQVMATAKPGQNLGEIQRVIDDEIAKLKTTPVTAEEIERAYVELESRIILGLQTVLGKAEQLNRYATFLDDPGYLGKDLGRYRSVTAADVQQAARAYLTDKRVVLSVLPRRTPSDGTTAAHTPAAGTPAGSAAPPSAPVAALAARPAQGSQTTVRARTMDLSLLPKGGPDPKLTLPAVQRRRLSNGLDVLVVEHRELPVVNLNLVVKTGGASDPQAKGGLAQLTADMLDEGTQSRSTAVIADQLSAIGAELSLTAGWDATTASLQVLTRHLDAALDLYADVITNPAFPEQELARLKDTRLADLRMRRDRPEDVAGLVVQRVLYPRDHTYAHPLSGDEPSLTSITRQDLRAFYDAHVRPNNAALIVVGDVRAADIVAKLEKAFASWKPGPTPSRPASSPPPPRDRAGIYLVDRPGSVQSVVQVAQVGVPRNTPDFFPLLVMNRILGGATSARLYMNLRQDKGYTYGVTSAFSYRRDAGPFVARAAVQGFSTRESVIEFLKELHGIRGGIPVSPEEIESARQAIIRGFPRGFETPEQMAANLETVVTHELPDTYFNSYTQKIAAVTLDDLNRVAKQYLHPDRMAIVIVGDRQSIEQPLRTVEGYGANIALVDADGRPVPLR